jgi:hypothetical protein
MFRIPIGGWNKCLHEAAAFESRGEYAAATILDRSAAVDWWFRNDPARFRIPTPVGNFEPDFVYSASRSKTATYGVLEIKADIFWNGEGSDPRIKSEAACRWVEAANAAAIGGPCWEFAIVLDTDAIAAGSLEELRRIALMAAP